MSYFGLVSLQDSYDGSGDGTSCSIHLATHTHTNHGDAAQLPGMCSSAASSALLLCGRTVGCHPHAHTGY